MGTVLEVSVLSDDRERARDLAEGALAVGRHWEEVLTTWRPEGELARFNRSAGDWEAVGADLALALRQMSSMAVSTGGAFDPAVGALVADLREGDAGDAARAAFRPIGTALLLRAGEAKLAPGTALDAGGIGKGIALDAMAAYLREGGARSAFLDFGGSSQLAFGFAEEPPRMVLAGLRNGTVLGAVDLRDQSLSTSRSLGTQKAGAIVDPRDLRPVTQPRVATVVAPTATLAEVWSTALIVLGREGVDTAVRQGLHVLYEDERGVVSSPGFPMTEGSGLR